MGDGLGANYPPVVILGRTQCEPGIQSGTGDILDPRVRLRRPEGDETGELRG